MAINILGKFLSNRDNNIRYGLRVALSKPNTDAVMSRSTR